MQTRSDRYSREFYLIIGKPPFHFEYNPIFLEYKRKWREKHSDPCEKLLNGAVIYKDDKCEDEKFSFLQKADSRTRITIVGHYESVGDDLKGFDGELFNHKKIIDIIRFNVHARDVLLENKRDFDVDRRALRIRFIACNVGAEFKNKISLAQKMFEYAVNDTVKPIRIEIVAPRMFVGPWLFSPHLGLSVFSARKRLMRAGVDTLEFHKMYATGPYFQGKLSITDGAGIFSYIWPKYRPQGYKIIMKIDNDKSRVGNVVPRKLAPEEDREEMLKFDSVSEDPGTRITMQNV